MTHPFNTTYTFGESRDVHLPSFAPNPQRPQRRQKTNGDKPSLIKVYAEERGIKRTLSNIYNYQMANFLRSLPLAL